jgi:GAF domain-containing protein
MKLPIFNTPQRPTPDEYRQPGETVAPPAVPSDIKPPADGTNDTSMDVVDSLRPKILDRLLWIAVLLGALVFALILPGFLEPVLPSSSLMTLSFAIGLALYTLVWIALVIAAVRRRMALARRLALLLLALFATGLALLLAGGLAGSGQVVLVAIPFLAAILSGRRGRTAGLALGLGGLILASILFWTGVVPPIALSAGTPGGSPLYWIVAILIFTLLAVSGALALGLLLDQVKASLAHQQGFTGELKGELARAQDQISERTDDLHRRLVQIRTVAEINRAISQLLDIDQLLPEVCELVRQRFDLYYVGIFLIDLVEPRNLLRPETGLDFPPEAEKDPAKANRPGAIGYAVLKAGTGEAGRIMLAAGHKLAVGGDSMIGWATANRQPRIALTVGQQNEVNVIGRFDNPHLPLTRSELALPILAGEAKDLSGAGQETRVLGAMTIQSSQDQAFDQDDIVILQGIADGLASAIENARLFQATQASLEEIRTLHRQYLEQAWQEEIAQRGEIAYTYEDKTGAVLGSVVGIAAGGNGDGKAAQSKELLEMPIRLRDQVIGSLVLDPGSSGTADVATPHDWSADELALIEAVTNQAALALDNARLLEETRRKVNQEHTAAAITSKLWASADIETILRTALQELGSSLGAREGLIELWPAETASAGRLPVEGPVTSWSQNTGEVANAGK